MFVDIHTHRKSESNYPCIRNLTFQEAEVIFNSNKKGYFSVGFHPWFVNEFSEELFKKLEKWAIDSRFVAFGECGLDKNSHVDLNIQIEVFKRQILLSETLLKPLIIHCVGCFNELFELKKHLNPAQRWIIHGFRGKPELTRQALKAGCDLSIGERFNAESVRIIPIDKLFAETDESLLPIETIIYKIAEIKSVEPELLNAGEVLLRNQIQ
jgi:TatD DNase family protein